MDKNVNIEDVQASETLKYLLPPVAYAILKWVALIAIPAIVVFVGIIPGVEAWQVSIIGGVGLLIGALIGVSNATAK